MSKPIRPTRPARPAGVIASDAAFQLETMRPFLAQPGFLLARINQIYASLYNELSNGETLAQAELLLLLASREGLDQISLARAAGLDTSTTALILDNLASRELLVRETDADDRRRSLLRLTAAGRKRVIKTRAAFLETQSYLEAPACRVSVAEVKRLLRLIAANPLGPAPPWIPEDRDDGIGDNILTGTIEFLTRRALQVCEASFLACTASLNLNTRQFSVLFIVNRLGAMSQAAFSRIFGLDPATSAVIMKNLAARGLLDRRVSIEDRRERLYSLTPEGRRHLQAAQPLIDKAVGLVLHALTKTEIRQLVAYLQQIVKTHSQRLTFPGVSFSD